MLVKKLKTLKLTGCANIIGHWLRTIRGSVVLQHIDSSLIGKHESPTLNPEPTVLLVVGGEEEGLLDSMVAVIRCAFGW